LGNNNAEWGEILDVDNYWSNVTVTTRDQGSTFTIIATLVRLRDQKTDDKQCDV